MTSSTSTTRQINRTIRQDPRWAAILARATVRRLTDGAPLASRGTPAEEWCGVARGGRHLLLFRQDDRRVLPSFLCGAAASAGECPVSCDLRGCRAGRVPSVQALSARAALVG